MGLTAAYSFCITIFIGIALHLFTDALPRLSRTAVLKAARRLPSAIRHDHELAWLADLAILETDFERLRCVGACWSTSLIFRYPFALEQSHRNLIVARNELKFHGTVVLLAMKRLKAWGTSGDVKYWSFAERWCFGILVTSGKNFPIAMKKYVICLNEDLKTRPRNYSCQEEASDEICIPILREMQIWKFLRKHHLLQIDGKIVQD